MNLISFTVDCYALCLGTLLIKCVNCCYCMAFNVPFFSFRRSLKTMQVFVTFPELELAAVSVTVGVDSLVSDVLKGAAFEWDVDPEEVELSFAGDTLDETERLADHGLGADSEMEMRKKLFQLFGKCWFVDESKREKLLQWLGNHNEEYLNLDTPTFSEDGCLSVSKHLLPSVVERISFRNSNSDITIISRNFMRDSSITSLDLSGLSSVTAIGNYFMSSCSQLTAVDLSGLNSVTTIGYYFLFHSHLTSVDLSGFSSLTIVGSYFMSSCSQLTSLDLSSLSSLTTIGDNFLFHSHLTALDLSGLSSLTTTGNYSLYSCSQLTSLDLSGLSNLIIIGHFFLSCSHKLTSLDLSGLSSVITIEEGFLSSCSQLTAVDLSGLSSLTTIGGGFLYSCSRLTTVDLSSLSSVTTIGDSFLYFCLQLTTLDLSGLRSVTTMGNNFLHECSQLATLDLSSLSSVTEVGDGFLTKTIAHESVQLPSNNRAVFEQCYKKRSSESILKYLCCCFN